VSGRKPRRRTAALASMEWRKARTYLNHLPLRSAWSEFVNAPWLVLGGVAGKRDKVPSEILFRGEGVVSATAERDVVQTMRATSREGERVV
jgi:hypothetical protein